jgi:hypothetical protein
MAQGPSPGSRPARAWRSRRRRRASRAGLGLEVFQGVEHRSAIRRRVDDSAGRRRERDEPDAEAVRELVDEVGRRLLRRIEPGRLDIRGQHRSRDVDREHDRCLFPGNRQDHRRAGHADRERGDRGEVQDGRDVAPPGRPARDEIREQVDVREADRVA